MSYGIFGVLHQSVDQGFNFLDLRFSFFLQALYPKEPSLALAEFLHARFKNIEESFYRCKSLLVALFPDWRSRCTSSARGEYPTSRSSCSLPCSS
ncbi:hypothetical protein B296_00029328 [Ensete ventricosum]|uniref:Uncharacterized protein n=1 Tax=Ensete ventricosum TaxID=4639 RepID=A0A426ZGQ6_ENSVE|nr:hypothetical protein B296_00029328 [Ensete ventricosum]